MKHTTFYVFRVILGKKRLKIFQNLFQGSSKSGFLGEASIDFADFLTETEPVTVSLPLKFANSGAVLNVLFSSPFETCV